MNDSGDQVTKNKQTNIDVRTDSCTKMVNTCALHFLCETQFTDVNQKVDNKAAERSRLYRERHKDRINQRRRDIRQRQQNSKRSYNASNAQKTEKNNKPTTNSHTLRQQRYYERHKEEINQRKRDRRLKQNISPSISLSPLTTAERNRKYRERNKKVINERRRYSRQRQKNDQQIHRECNINNIETIQDACNVNNIDTVQDDCNINNMDSIQDALIKSRLLLMLHTAALIGQSFNAV